MARGHRHDKFSRKVTLKKDFPQIHLDREADFASIKMAPGIEASSYLKDGFVFCEDAKGKIIEVQILNLSQLRRLAKRAA